MKTLLFTTLMFILSLSAHASDQAKVITTYKGPLTGNGNSKQHTVALVNMDTVFDRPGDNCSQFVGMITVEGIQFSDSGATLQSFRFTDKVSGAQWSVPTNIMNLSKIDRDRANSFIRVGNSYLTHIQVCGSGGFASLISMYNANLGISPFVKK